MTTTNAKPTAQETSRLCRARFPEYYLGIYEDILTEQCSIIVLRFGKDPNVLDECLSYPVGMLDRRENYDHPNLTFSDLKIIMSDIAPALVTHAQESLGVRTGDADRIVEFANHMVDFCSDNWFTYDEFPEVMDLIKSLKVSDITMI